VCENPFAPDDTRIRDHLTGRYKSPVHSNCNLNYKDSHYILIIFHNLSGYDAHFIIKEIATAYEKQVNLLPMSKEKYISFTKNVKSTENKDKKTCIKLRFIYTHINFSRLDKLASYLSKDNNKLQITRIFQIIRRKFRSIDTKGCLSIRIHWLRRKVGRDVYHRANCFTVHWRVTPYPRAITRMAPTCGSGSPSKRLGYIAIYISKPTSCHWPISLKIFATIAVLVGFDFAYYYSTEFYMGRDVKTYAHQFRTAYRRRHGHVHWTRYTRRFESMAIFTLCL